MKTRDIFLGVALALAGVALAQTVQRSLGITINGKAVSSKALVVQNQTYVPLAALSSLGIKGQVNGNTLALTGTTSAEGGANQIGALEGCLGETLFNGMIRVKVSSLARLETVPDWTNFKGWAINAEFRNGTNERLSLYDMGLKGAPSIVRASGSLLAADTTGVSSRDWDTARNTVLLPGASLNQIIKFVDLDSAPDALPTKLLFDVDAKGIKPKINAKYTIPDPSFRINLSCQK